MNSTAGDSDDRVSGLSALPYQDLVQGNHADCHACQVESQAGLVAPQNIGKLGNLSSGDRDVCL